MNKPICEECNWSNTGLLNLGGLDENGTVNRWVCHGCCKRVIEQRDTLSSQLTRRDAAFAALLEYAKAEEHSHRESAICENCIDGFQCDDVERESPVLTEQRREALKLAEGVVRHNLGEVAEGGEDVTT